MIVPRYRLITLAAAVSLPLSLLFAMDPSTLVFVAALMVCLLLAALLDALGAPGRLNGVRATFPEIFRLSKDRDGELSIEVVNEKDRVRRLRLGVAFPSGIASPYEETAVSLPKGEERSIVTWPCTGLRRGNHTIENVYLETDSPLGLWSVRKTSATRCEARVYPNILRDRKNLAALFLNRGMLGIHARRQVGKGREFEKLREYIPGDSYDDVHWKATAKRGHPVTKVFQIERTQEVYVIIDSSRLSARTVAGPAPETQLERFITSAMVLGLVAEKQGDLFGLAAFSDQVRSFVRARNGKAHHAVCRDALYTLEPNMVNPDFGEAFSFLRLRLRRRALLIFLTNLDDPMLAESFVRNLDVLARHHLVLVNMLNLPGADPLFSEAEATAMDDVYQRLGGHLQWQKLRELQRTLKHRGVSMTMLDNETMCPQLVSRYIDVKRRQAL